MLLWKNHRHTQRVVELLKNTAASHPGVAKEPLPQVYVTNFSAGAVTFQLRAWTDRHDDWAQLHSDLSVAVNDVLAREKIAIGAAWKAARDEKKIQIKNEQ
jgi:small-conductance mechanosensitive channel